MHRLFDPTHPARRSFAFTSVLMVCLVGCGPAPAQMDTENTMDSVSNNGDATLRVEAHFQGAERALAEAAAAGKATEVRRLAAAGANPGAVSDQGMPLLLWPIRNGNLAGVRALLDAGAPVDVRDGYGNTPLVWAIRAREAAIASTLIDHRADVDAREDSGEPVLKMAVARGLWDVAEHLLDKGAAIDAAAVEGAPWTALASVASSGNFEQAHRLLERGANPAIPLSGGPFPDRIGARPVLESLHHHPVCPGTEQARWKERVIALLNSQGHPAPPRPRRYTDSPPLRC